MLKIFLNRLKLPSDHSRRTGRIQSSTTEIFNLRTLCSQERYHTSKSSTTSLWILRSSTGLAHSFVGNHEAVWHQRQPDHDDKSISMKRPTAVYFNGSIRDWFRTTAGVRQGSLLYPTVFSIFLERITTDILKHCKGTASIGGKTITSLCFVNNIDGVAGNGDKLTSLMKCLSKTSAAYGIDTSTGKTKMIASNINGISTGIRINGKN